VDHKQVVETEKIKSAIRTAISIEHELQVDDIRLSVPGGIPKTTSGKIKHHLCKTHYIGGTLKEFGLT